MPYTYLTPDGGYLVSDAARSDLTPCPVRDDASLTVWDGTKWVAPAPTPNWIGLLDWAALNVPVADLWALQTSMNGSFMNTAAMTGNWGAPDGSGTGAAYWYVKLKADVAANPGNYTATTGTTLATVAAKFSDFGVPINP